MDRPGAEPSPAISRWRAARSTEILQRSFSDPDFDDASWQPIAVPAHWQTQAGFADFEGTLLYRADVVVPRLQAGQRRWLHLDGLCYTGDVFFDGVYLGQTEGYFSPHSFEMTDLAAAPGSSVLAIEVGAPRRTEGEPNRSITGWFTNAPGTPPGWNPAGIWQAVSIVDTGPVAIRHFRAICADADADRAIVKLRAVLLAEAPQEVELVTEVAGTDEVTPHTIAAGENRVEWQVEVPHPELWWPHSRGAQPLFDLRVQARVDATISDRRNRRIGFRTTSMRDFVLRINGERLFARGVNLAPFALDLAGAEVKAMRSELEQIRSAGFDLVRVRSHVTRREIYDACDELGLLVWQDLPLEGQHVRGIGDQAEQQARDMVDLLGHHPAIVIWGGHMRPHTSSPRSTASPNIREQQIPSWNRTILDRGVRRTLTSADPSRPVIAHSDVVPHVPHLSGSDIGLFFGWFDGEASDIAEFAAALPRFVRFVSDMGAQALPATIERDLDDLLNVVGAETDALQRSVPATAHADVQSWIDRTRTYQAAVLKSTLETLRVLKYNPVGGFCAGLWRAAAPGLTRALLDHNGGARPAVHAATTALAPVLPILYPPSQFIPARTSTVLSLHICNDLQRDVAVEVTASLNDGRGASTRTWDGEVPSDDVAFISGLSIRGGRIGDVATVELKARGEGVSSVNSYSFEAT